jgi:ABC-type sulfate/molybdate transport systems ATPase subunit
VVLRALEHARESVGVVVVSHDAEEFLGSADRVLALSAGAPAFSGSSADLLLDPSPLVDAGVGMPPLIEAQVLVREAGCALPRLSTDPAEVARQMVASRDQGRG